jgi:hypothetical protein
MLPPGYQKAEEVAQTVTQEAVNVIEPPIEIQKLKERAETWAAEEEEQKTLFEKFDATKSDSLGWVQKHEVKIAKKRIVEALGFEPPPMAGFYMAIAIHEEKFARTMDGKKSVIINAAADEDKYRNPTGLVVSQGPWCYQGEHFKEPILSRICRFFFGRWMEPSIYRPWCRVGDFVVLPRHEGQMINYRGVPLMMIRDTKIYSPIENPSFVSREFK